MGEISIDDLRKAIMGPQSIWDHFVPLVKKDNRIDVFLTTDIETPNNYDELCYELDNATSDTVVTIHLNTYGGVLDAAKRVHNAMKRSDAHVIVKCSGSVISAGTIIAMAADELIMEPFVSFMIHYYSGGNVGKGHELKAAQTFTDKDLPEYYKFVYNKFLTEDEITSVVDGKDLWMGSEEVAERWNRTRS